MKIDEHVAKIIEQHRGIDRASRLKLAKELDEKGDKWKAMEVSVGRKIHPLLHPLEDYYPLAYLLYTLKPEDGKPLISTNDFYEKICIDSDTLEYDQMLAKAFERRKSEEYDQRLKKAFEKHREEPLTKGEFVDAFADMRTQQIKKEKDLEERASKYENKIENEISSLEALKKSFPVYLEETKEDYLAKVDSAIEKRIGGFENRLEEGLAENKREAGKYIGKGLAANEEKIEEHDQENKRKIEYSRKIWGQESEARKAEFSRMTRSQQGLHRKQTDSYEAICDMKRDISTKLEALTEEFKQGNLDNKVTHKEFTYLKQLLYDIMKLKHIEAEFTKAYVDTRIKEALGKDAEEVRARKATQEVMADLGYSVIN